MAVYSPMGGPYAHISSSAQIFASEYQHHPKQHTPPSYFTHRHSDPRDRFRRRWRWRLWLLRSTTLWRQINKMENVRSTGRPVRTTRRRLLRRQRDDEKKTRLSRVRQRGHSKEPSLFLTSGCSSRFDSLHTLGRGGATKPKVSFW